MAKLALDISQFKSAGVYTIEVTQSERITVATQSLRLLPGFSVTGLYNSPVFIRSTKDRQRFFGDIDTKMERKGSFFQRSIDTCLLQAPVFAINLIKTDNSPSSATKDEVNLMAMSLAVDTSVGEDDTTAVSDLYQNFFDRQKFWIPDEEFLQSVTTNKYGAANNKSAPLLSFTNLSTTPMSFLVRKAVGLSGYGILAKDWYLNETNIPYEWIRPNDKMQDYFINILAVEGDWTNYSALSVDPTYSTYFDANGILPTKLQEFLNLPNINLKGSWYGSIIPDFKDQTGSNQYIEALVNSSTPLTGILLNVNKEALDELIWDEATNSQWELGDGSDTVAAPYQVDLVGHNFADSSAGSGNITNTFLSYNIDVSASIMFNDVSINMLGTTGKSFEIDASIDQTKITVGTLIKSAIDGSIAPGVTYVQTKIFDTSTYVYSTASPIFDYLNSPASVQSQLPIDDASVATHYKLFKLNGLVLQNRHLPGYSEAGATNLEAGVTNIYSMLEDDGILRGLMNPDMIQYRYVVDTMGYGLGSNLGGKVYLSRLAKKRGKTTALLSTPSFRQFATSQDPYFTDLFVPGVDSKPSFSTEWIAQGGNPDMVRSFRFTLPDEDNGSKYCGVFGPYLRYNENGKAIYIPPAADVSNTYVRKFLGGNPYAIVANQNGIISNPQLAGVEYLVDQTDRDYLEPMGINSIIERPNVGQVMIFANVTSYQNVNSDLNYLHVRELLNTIEIQVEEILKNFTFQYNNPITRLTIINSITPILESIKDSGALFDYEVIMDESNNTDAIISDGFGIIDVGVWINKGLEKIINRVTVNNLGSVSSGGFSLN